MSSLRDAAENLDKIRRQVQHTVGPLLDSIRAQGYPDATIEDLAVLMGPSDDRKPVSEPARPDEAKRPGKTKARKGERKGNGAVTKRSAQSEGSTVREIIAAAAADLKANAFSPEDLVAKIRETRADIKATSIKRTIGGMVGSELERLDRGRYRLRKSDQEKSTPVSEERAG